MDYAKYNQLIDRYFQGETSLEEEASLRAYFRSEQVDPRLAQYAPWFDWLHAEAGRSAPPTLAMPGPRAAGLGRGWRWSAGIAAMLALGLGSWALYQYAQPAPEPVAQTIDWSKYEVTDPDEALRITQAALRRTSRALNQGARQAADELGKVRKLASPL